MSNTSKECRYKAVYRNKRRTLTAKRDVQSEPLPNEGAARAWLAQNAPRGSGQTILKEHDREINEGKFFLHLIVK